MQTPEGKKWVDVLDRYALPDTPERAWANFGLGLVKQVTGENSAAVRLFSEGAALARKFGEIEAFIMNGSYYLWRCPSKPDFVEEGRRLVDEMMQVWGKCGFWAKGWGVALVSSFLTALGERDRAENLIRENIELLRRSRQPFFIGITQHIDAGFQLMDGQLLEAVETVARYTQFGEEAGIDPHAHMWAGFANIPLAGYLETCQRRSRKMNNGKKPAAYTP